MIHQFEERNPLLLLFSLDNEGTRIALYPMDELAKDINKENPLAISTGFSGITLAYNAKSVEEVDEVLNSAKLAGAKIIKEPKKMIGEDMVVISLTLMVTIGKLHFKN